LDTSSYVPFTTTTTLQWSSGRVPCGHATQFTNHWMSVHRGVRLHMSLVRCTKKIQDHDRI